MDEAEIMCRVVELSRKGMSEGKGGPFGCVIVRDGEIVGEAHNEVLATKDPTAHAETLAIRRASAALQSFDLSDCDIYTIGAPCCMCASAILWARLKRSYYVLPMEDSAAIGLGDDHLYAELARPLDAREIVPMIQLPALTDEARAVYQDWFNRSDRVSF
jgi:tRNA(Arg) A34 adenosine deaminase TadA